MQYRRINIQKTSGGSVMKIKKVAGILLAGTMMISMAACGGKEEGAKSEKLIVGTEAGFAPYEYMKGNEVVGIDMDIAKAIADEMGKELEIKNMDFDGALAAVQSGKVDFVAAGVSISPEREEAMSLSQAYLNNKIVIMTKEGVTVSAKEALANYNIGIQAGSAALEAVTNDAVYASIQDKITEYPTYDEVILDVQAGRLDCMIIDEVYGGYKNAKLGSIFAVSEVDFGDDL